MSNFLKDRCRIALPMTNVRSISPNMSEHVKRSFHIFPLPRVLQFNATTSLDCTLKNNPVSSALKIYKVDAKNNERHRSTLCPRHVCTKPMTGTVR